MMDKCAVFLFLSSIILMAKGDEQDDPRTGPSGVFNPFTQFLVPLEGSPELPPWWNPGKLGVRAVLAAFWDNIHDAAFYNTPSANVELLDPHTPPTWITRIGNLALIFLNFWINVFVFGLVPVHHLKSWLDEIDYYPERYMHPSPYQLQGYWNGVKNHYYPDDRMPQEDANYYHDDRMPQEDANYYHDDRMLQGDANYYPDDRTLQGDANYYPDDRMLQGDANYYPDDHMLQGDANYYPDDHMLQEGAN